MNSEVFGRKLPWPNLTYYAGICVEELKRITKISISVSDIPARIRTVHSRAQIKTGIDWVTLFGFVVKTKWPRFSVNMWALCDGPWGSSGNNDLCVGNRIWGNCFLSLAKRLNALVQCLALLHRAEEFAGDALLCHSDRIPFFPQAFSIHHPLIVLHSGAIYSELLTAALNKP
jgi:hypothetical protein